MPIDEVLGIPEIAEMFRVQRPTVDQWLQRGVFPAPDGTVGGRPAWRRGTALTWGRSTGRLGKTPPVDVDPFWQWRDCGGGMVAEMFRSVDPDTGQDVWVHCCSFLHVGVDGGWQAFPKSLGADGCLDPEQVQVITQRHLRAWLQRQQDWAREHPGELLPAWFGV